MVRVASPASRGALARPAFPRPHRAWASVPSDPARPRSAFHAWRAWRL